MVLSAEDQILIKVWPANSPDLNLVDYCRPIWVKLDSWRGSAEVTSDRRMGTIPAVGH